MLDKQECYSKLFLIKNKGIDITVPLRELVISDEPSISVLEFINNNEGIDTVTFYESLRGKCNSKQSKLYKELLKEDATDYDLSKSLASLVTQVIIFSENMNDSDRRNFYKHMKLSECMNSLSDYFYKYDPSGLRNIRSDIVREIKYLVR